VFIYEVLEDRENEGIMQINWVNITVYQIIF